MMKKFSISWLLCVHMFFLCASGNSILPPLTSHHRSEEQYSQQGKEAECQHHNPFDNSLDLLISLDKNQLKEALLTTLRDVSTSCADFQDATNKLAHYLVFKVSECLEVEEKKEVQTSEGMFKDGVVFTKSPILISIFRAGLSLLPTFQDYFKEASVGFFGIKRNEKTAEPMCYYQNIPQIKEDDQVIILETMLATGGSSGLAVSLLKKAGAQEKNIIIVTVIAAKQGVECLAKKYPAIRIVTAALDEEINDRYYIVPGLGDYGDRYFRNDNEQNFTELPS